MTRPIGYGSPPTHTKWTKGQSGNPSGRKKGSRNLATDLAEELAASVQVTEGGKRVRMSKQRALVKSLIAGALNGNARSASELLRLIVRQVPPDPNEARDAPISADDEAMVAAFLTRHAGKGGQP